MIIKFSPEDGAEQSWTYLPKRVKQSEAEMLEKRADMTFEEFNKALFTGAARPRKVILWHCLRKEHPVYRWEDVPDFAMSEVSIEFDAKELVDIRDAVAKSPSMTETARAEALEMLDDQISKLPESGLPKADLKSSESDTDL